MLVIGILVVIAIVVAAVVLGRKSNDASFISFPCRTCQTVQQVSVAETMRRVSEAHAKGALGELSKHEIKCMKCGASQTADWLMHPRVKKMINDLDAKIYRDQTAAEYMNIASADSPGAPSLSASAIPPAAVSPPSVEAAPLAAPPAVPADLASPPPVPKPDDPHRS